MDSIPGTMVDILRHRAAEQADQRAYTFLADGDADEDSVTYGELDRQSRAIGTRLQSFGASGERVLLLLPPGLQYVAAFFGCLYADAVAVPAYPPRQNNNLVRLQSVARDARAIFGITTGPILRRLESQTVEETLRTVTWFVIDEIEEDLCTQWKEPGLRRDSLALIQYTSGSTATPKGVMVSHGNLLENSAMIHRRFGHRPDSRGVIWLPPYHDMGLIGGVIQPLYGGFPVTLMSPVAFLMRPIRWLQAVSRTRATTSGGPNFAYDLCVRKVSAEQRSALDLSCWRVAFNGSERVHSDTLERFAAAFAECGFRREAFHPCYGLAEATLFVSGGPGLSPRLCKVQSNALQHHRVVPANGQQDATSLVACGEPAAELQAVIVDPDRFTRCPPDQVGEIWLSGASVALGYWNRPEETRMTFRAYTSDTGEGPFLRTGDLGFFLDGHLVVAGRLKDLIILAGRNHYPQDIERTVEQAHPALRPGGCAAFSVDRAGEEQLMVMVEIEPRKTHTGDSLNEAGVVQSVCRAVAEHHGVRVHKVFLLRPNSIPKTTSGKIRRQACRSWFSEADAAK
jgi:acyl-CoA synthetase (AMP-forming)/AMP-acid ligase II